MSMGEVARCDVRIINFALGVSILVGLAGMTRTRAIEGRTGVGLFAGLRVGQPVTIKDLGLAYEVGVMVDRFPTGREIAEVGTDYLVVRDVTGAVETRIPVTSIKAVTRYHGPVPLSPDGLAGRWAGTGETDQNHGSPESR